MNMSLPPTLGFYGSFCDVVEVETGEVVRRDIVVLVGSFPLLYRSNVIIPRRSVG